jgi:tetratricopeptide (TPR) repeat protein
MKSAHQTLPSPDQPLSREVLLTLLDGAVNSGDLRYTRRLCTSWLAIYPGDLQVSLLYARAFLLDQSASIRAQAIPILEEICKADPEFLEAQETLAKASSQAGTQAQAMARSCAHALAAASTSSGLRNDSVPAWSKSTHEARVALKAVRAGDYQQIDKAEHFIHKALVENPDTPLAAVTHLRLLESKVSMPKQAIRSLAKIYHDKWPDCLQFQLSLAHSLMESGEANQAVEMLHQAVSRDITGQVARRMWGEQHPYALLWPVYLSATNTSPNSPQNIPIPAGVAARLKGNQNPPSIPASNTPAAHLSPTSRDPNGFEAVEVAPAKPELDAQTATEQAISRLSESSQNVQNELERMAGELKRPHLAHADGRFPVYIIFTTLGGLRGQYPAQSIQEIDARLKKLAGTIHGRRINQEFWGARLFYADDPACTQPLGLSPAPYTDAWKLKLIIGELDTALAKRGERIGAVLIVGGPEIVPFHNLPNPVEDADVEVASDNPYATKDNNYFISDWPVGRVSGGSGTDASRLLAMIHEITARYDQNASRPAWLQRLMRYFHELFQAGLSKKLSSFGYTAAVWRRASLSVFRSIGNSSDLLISPPVHACEDPTLGCADHVITVGNCPPSECLLLPDTQLAYFNLHGVPDASEWYGQSDPTLPEVGPEFPVAMRPQDIRNSGSAPRLVFTEACYGANIIGKQVEDAIALKFLASGTQAVIGSTCISYGSLSTPLSSADLLGRAFWSLLQEGFTTGEAFRRSKIQLTREMNQRQGFLDAEDQKTLISFVLFGDPLAQPFNTRVSPKVTPHLSDDVIQVPTVCEKSCEGEAGSSVSLETISHLKTIVAQYLPGMNDATISLSHEHQTCSNLCTTCGCGKQCQFAQANAKTPGSQKPQRRVVTLSKNFERAERVHKQYARLTLDEHNKIIKMVVSH